MNRFAAIFLITVGALGASAPGHAQATRTWVSGVGDDVNPCSRTAPCKTFAGAISKTAAGGEISALDPGGFGGVTIVKSITLNGDGNLTSILVSGTNGVTVMAARMGLLGKGGRGLKRERSTALNKTRTRSRGMPAICSSRFWHR